MSLPKEIYANRHGAGGELQTWDVAAVHAVVSQTQDQAQRSTERALDQSGLLPAIAKIDQLVDEFDRPGRVSVARSIDEQARSKRKQSLIAQLHQTPEGQWVLFPNDARGGRRWLFLDSPELDSDQWLALLDVLTAGKNSVLWPTGALVKALRPLVPRELTHDLKLPSGALLRLGLMAYRDPAATRLTTERERTHRPSTTMTHLDRLEAESIHIIREVMALAENPVLLYSVGKDSSVMLHLARKAFAPSVPPFPLLHVDTRWECQEVYDFRDAMAKESGMDLIVHINPEGIEKDINPFDHGSALHTDIMKTQALKQALDEHKFDVAFGGARRDEEKSRAKERVFSFRNEAHRWDPKNQRPELWNLYNAHKRKGESIRVFPLSNWTELDIWQYIYRESIPIVPLYFSAERPVVTRDDMLIVVDDDRMALYPDEKVEMQHVRYRSLGCYPLTGAFDSKAADLSDILLELLESRVSERQGRAIDRDAGASMEQKKQEGYF
ncbi:MAG: sulfate adenylyltransferase subunit CysD [Pseudomonadota bacterium]